MYVQYTWTFIIQSLKFKLKYGYDYEIYNLAGVGLHYTGVREQEVLSFESVYFQGLLLFI